MPATSLAMRPRSSLNRESGVPPSAARVDSYPDVGGSALGGISSEDVIAVLQNVSIQNKWVVFWWHRRCLDPCERNNYGN